MLCSWCFFIGGRHCCGSALDRLNARVVSEADPSVRKEAMPQAAGPETFARRSRERPSRQAGCLITSLEFRNESVCVNCGRTILYDVVSLVRSPSLLTRSELRRQRGEIRGTHTGKRAITGGTGRCDGMPSVYTAVLDFSRGSHVRIGRFSSLARSAVPYQPLVDPGYLSSYCKDACG